MDHIVNVRFVGWSMFSARPLVAEPAELYASSAIMPGRFVRSKADLESPVGRNPVYRQNIQQPAMLEIVCK